MYICIVIFIYRSRRAAREAPFWAKLVLGTVGRTEVWSSLYVCMHIRVCIYIYIHIYTYTYIYIYIERERDIDMYIYIYIYIYTHIVYMLFIYVFVSFVEVRNSPLPWALLVMRICYSVVCPALLRPQVHEPTFKKVILYHITTILYYYYIIVFIYIYIYVYKY